MKKLILFSLLSLLFTTSIFSQKNKKGNEKAATSKAKINKRITPPEPSINGFPYVHLEVDTLTMEADSIPEEELIFFVGKMKDRAIQLENIIIQNKQRVEYARRILEDDLKFAKKSKDKDESLIDDMKSQIKYLKKEEKRLSKTRSEANRVAQNAVDIASGSVDNMRKNFAGLKESVSRLAKKSEQSRDWVANNLHKNEPTANLDFIGAEMTEADTPIEDVDTPVEKEKKKKKKKSKDVDDKVAKVKKKKKKKKKAKSEDVVEAKPKKKKKKKKKATERLEEEEGAIVYDDEDEMPETIEVNQDFASTMVKDTPAYEIPEPAVRPVYTSDPSRYAAYNPTTDVLRNPPSISCKLQVDKIDEFSGKIYKQTSESELFRYTNDYMKPYLDGKPHIRCYASMSQLGEVITINFTLKVRDNNAKKAFGGMSKGSLMTLRFIDGNTESSPNYKQENIVTEEGGTVTVFKGQFPTSKAILKRLTTKELDKVRIQWNAGFEDYEIYNIDLMMQQAKCILNQ